MLFHGKCTQLQFQRQKQTTFSPKLHFFYFLVLCLRQERENHPTFMVDIRQPK
jgi:hypothetical protein